MVAGKKKKNKIHYFTNADGNSFIEKPPIIYTVGESIIKRIVDECCVHIY